MKSLLLMTLLLAGTASINTCNAANQPVAINGTGTTSDSLLLATARYTWQHYPVPPYEKAGVSKFGKVFRHQGESCSRITFEATRNSSTIHRKVVFCHKPHELWHVSH